MHNKATAIVFPDAGQIDFMEFELPECGPDQVVAETIYSFVSPGTELRVLSGVGESAGKFPVIPGYSWVGRIIQVGKDVKGWSEGDLVTGRNSVPFPGITELWGGQASLHRCEVTGYCSVLRLPEGADPWDYVTAEVAAISWRGITAAYPSPGETAVVIGQGLIGAFCAKWLLWHGAKVIVVDPVTSRLDRAMEWGASAGLDGAASGVKEQILAMCDGGADIVVEASGSFAGVELACSILRQPVYRALNTAYPAPALRSNAAVWPRLVFQASYFSKIEALPCGNVGAEGAVVIKPADRTVGDRLAVIERIRKGDLPVADIIDSPVPVERAPEAYIELRDNKSATSAVAYSWDGVR